MAEEVPGDSSERVRAHLRHQLGGRGHTGGGREGRAVISGCPKLFYMLLKLLDEV